MSISEESLSTYLNNAIAAETAYNNQSARVSLAQSNLNWAKLNLIGAIRDDISTDKIEGLTQEIRDYLKELELEKLRWKSALDMYDIAWKRYADAKDIYLIEEALCPFCSVKGCAEDHYWSRREVASR